MSRGFTVLELLVVVAVLAILAGMGVAHAGRDRDRLQLLSAMRSLRIGLDRGRMAAERQRQPCGLSLTEYGWQAPVDSTMPACAAIATPLREDAGDAVQWRSNLPSVVRFTANGLVLDGGVVVLSHPLVPRQPCLVLSLPLGITRLGRYTAAADDRLRRDACRPDAHD